MTSLLQGAITLEYGLLAATIRADDKHGKRSTGDSCGSDCTNPADCGGEDNSCPAPIKEKDYPHPAPHKKAFSPALIGWSEPPAERI
jgi:hypothetical protein